MNDLVCPECESESIATIPTNHKFKYGCGENAIDIETVIPLRHCNACNFEYMDSEGMDIQDEAVKIQTKKSR